MKSSLLLSAQIGFIVLTLVYFHFLLRALKRGIESTNWDSARKSRSSFRLYAIPAAILLFVTAWSLSGIMADFSKFPFNFMPVLAVPLIAAVVLTFSPAFNEILKHVPQSSLITLQSFRFFVEILLWLLFLNASVPEQMTFEGRNFDILAGVTGPIVGWFLVRKKISRLGLAVWNIACLGLLINIVTIAILSTPSPIRVFMQEPANTIVTYFPISLLPGMLVPLAYTLHFFSLRKLATDKQLTGIPSLH